MRVDDAAREPGRATSQPLAVGRAQALRLLLALGGFVLLGWGLGALCRSSLTAAELPLVTRAVSSHTAGLTTLAHVLSHVGSAVVVYPAALIACVLLQRRGCRRQALALAAAVGGAAVIYLVDKALVARPRPAVPELEHAVGKSFPSGHATQSAAFSAGLLLILYARDVPRQMRVAAVGAGVLLVLGVMWSRVYLGMHYPSDVLAGAICGTAWSLVAYRTLGARGDRGANAGSRDDRPTRVAPRPAGAWRGAAGSVVYRNTRRAFPAIHRGPRN